MLSRVAESLYWMARYIERAEAVARLAAVDFQALLDGTRRGRLEDVVRITSEAALFRRHFPAGDEAGGLEFPPPPPPDPRRVPRGPFPARGPLLPGGDRRCPRGGGPARRARGGEARSPGPAGRATARRHRVPRRTGGPPVRPLAAARGPPPARAPGRQRGHEDVLQHA